jgi:hypothetical protein
MSFKTEPRKPSVWRSGRRKSNLKERCGLNGNVCIDGLSASLAGLRRCSGVDRVVTDPQGNVTAIAQRFGIFVPVLDAIGGFVLWMAIGSFVRFGHGAHRWLSGLSISKP